jgi:hypothetical protein
MEYEEFRRGIELQNKSLKKDFEDRYIVMQDGNYKPGVKSKVYPDRTEYEGQFVNGQREGKGVLYLDDNELYFGDWANDTLNGYGVYIFKNGERYTGEFVEGLREGVGKYIFFNGNYFDGTWKGGKKDGEGTYYFFGTDEKYVG